MYDFKDLTQAEKDYIKNDTEKLIDVLVNRIIQPICFTSRGCGKSFWIKHLFDKVNVKALFDESRTRQLARTRIEFSQLNRREINMNSKLKQLYKSFTGNKGSTYKKNMFPEGKIKGCIGFTATACTDGSCPIALKEQYPDRMVDAPTTCSKCYYRTGLCKDCIFEKTIYCTKGE